MKHVLQYKESCVTSKISNLAVISSKLWKHLKYDVKGLQASAFSVLTVNDEHKKLEFKRKLRG